MNSAPRQEILPPSERLMRLARFTARSADDQPEREIANMTILIRTGWLDRVQIYRKIASWFANRATNLRVKQIHRAMQRQREIDARREESRSRAKSFSGVDLMVP